jgi:DNA-binding transcriptional ArsR family regulator
MTETQETGDSRDALFRSLSDPTRRALFERLCREGEKTVVELTAAAGVSQPVVSKHLRKLREAGLVEGREDGRKTHYAARPAALEPLADWTRDMTDFWTARIDALESLLSRMDQ